MKEFQRPEIRIRRVSVVDILTDSNGIWYGPDDNAGTEDGGITADTGGFWD